MTTEHSRKDVSGAVPDRLDRSGPLTYLSLNCTLTHGPDESSTEVLLSHVCGLLEDRGVTGARVRVVDAGIAHGVTSDEGGDDGWPHIRDQILAADVLVLGTPIWLGHPSSVTQQVLERLDAFLNDIDDRGQMRSVNRVAMVCVVGNEDGAHHVGAETFQGLNDCGFTLAPGAMTYWVGEAMGSIDLKDLDRIPARTAATASTMVTNALHLASLLRVRTFPRIDPNGTNPPGASSPPGDGSPKVDSSDRPDLEPERIPQLSDVHIVTGGDIGDGAD